MKRGQLSPEARVPTDLIAPRATGEVTMTATTSGSAVWYFDGMTLVEPGASRADVVAHFLGSAPAVEGTAWLAGFTTERRRGMDAAAGKRITRDWRTAVVVLWADGEGAATLDMRTFRQVLNEVRAAGGADAILIHGRICTYHSRTFEFAQFGVRSQREE